MDKISSILPSNSRVTTVDMRNSGVTRSGTPSFGRQTAITAAQKKSDLEQMTATKANAEFKDQMNLRSTVKDPKAQIVQKLADDFFNKKAAQQEKDDVDLGLDSSTDMNIEVRPMGTQNNSSIKPFNVENEIKMAKNSRFAEADAVANADRSAGSQKSSSFSAASSNDESMTMDDEDSPATGRYLDVRV